METAAFGTSARAQILRLAFNWSFSVYRATSAYNEYLVLVAPLPFRIPYGKIIALTLTASLLTAALAGPLYGFLVLISPYLTLVLLNFVIAGFLLDASAKASLFFAKRYILHCLLYQMKPNIPFIVYLRPFAADSSFRLHLMHPIDWMEGSRMATGLYHDRIPIMDTLNSVDVVDRALDLTEKMGVCVQAGIGQPRGRRVVVAPFDKEWEKQINRLCEAALLIMFLPLFGVSLETNIEVEVPPPPEIAALLKKKEHEGLGIELHLLSNQGLVPKTVFIVPGLLSVRERDEVRRIVGEHGFVWPEDCPYISENNVRLYRCRIKGEVMRAVEIGPYRGRPFNEGLGPNDFSPVSGNLGDGWTIAHGNAIEYLLEDDAVERDRRWPPGRPNPRAPPRRRLEDGGPYVL